MIIVIMGFIFDNLRKTAPAFEQVRRCRRLSTRIAQHIFEYKRKLTVYTLCLTDKEKDLENVEKILYYDSNILQDLEDFVESGCPDLDKHVTKKIITQGLFGLVYIVSGFTLTTKSIPAAVLYIIIGLILLYLIGSQDSNANIVREFTLELDDKEMLLDYIVERLQALKELCEARGAKIHV